MKKEVKILGATLALALLTACGGGGGSSSGGSGGSGSGGNGPDFPDLSGPPGSGPLIPDVDEPSLSVFSDTNGSISQALAGGSSLFMRNVSRSTVLETFNETPVFRPVKAQVSVARDGNDLVVTMRGEGLAREYTARFPNAATNGSLEQTVRIPGSSLRMTIHTRGDGRINDYFSSSTRNARRLDVVVWDNQSFAFQTMGVIGTETRSSTIDTLSGLNATATYNGIGRLNVRDANQTFVDFNRAVQGNLSLTADFGARTVNGSIGNLTVFENEKENPQAQAGAILLNSGTISGNSFSGTMSADGTLAASNPAVSGAATGTFSGAFYGANANEVGGQLTGSSGSFLGYGHFVGQ
jgi:hypothetical protein